MWKGSLGLGSWGQSCTPAFSTRPGPHASSAPWHSSDSLSAQIRRELLLGTRRGRTGGRGGRPLRLGRVGPGTSNRGPLPSAPVCIAWHCVCLGPHWRVGSPCLASDWGPRTALSAPSPMVQWQTRGAEGYCRCCLRRLPPTSVDLSQKSISRKPCARTKGQGPILAPPRQGSTCPTRMLLWWTSVGHDQRKKATRVANLLPTSVQKTQGKWEAAGRLVSLSSHQLGAPGQPSWRHP